MAKRDGRVVKVHALNAMFPYMIRSRTESLVYFSTALDVEKLLAYIEKKKAEGGGSIRATSASWMKTVTFISKAGRSACSRYPA